MTPQIAVAPLVFGALYRRAVPVRSVDLNRKSGVGEREVDRVRPDGELWSRGDAARLKRRGDYHFEATDLGTVSGEVRAMARPGTEPEFLQLGRLHHDGLAACLASPFDARKERVGRPSDEAFGRVTAGAGAESGRFRPIGFDAKRYAACSAFNRGAVDLVPGSEPVDDLGAAGEDDVYGTGTRLRAVRSARRLFQAPTLNLEFDTTSAARSCDFHATNYSVDCLRMTMVAEA